MAVAVQTTGEPTRGTGGPLGVSVTESRQRSSSDFNCGHVPPVDRELGCLDRQLAYENASSIATSHLKSLNLRCLSPGGDR